MTELEAIARIRDQQDAAWRGEVEPRTLESDPEPAFLIEQMRAELILRGVNDPHRMRGRMSQVSRDDMVVLLSAVDRAVDEYASRLEETPR
jgi:hypothetical protein